MSLKDNTKPIYLRPDEYNNYIQESKEELMVTQGEISEEEKNLISRCGVDYGLTIDKRVANSAFQKPKKDYNIVFRIKGPFTLPAESTFVSELGSVRVKPYVIHESASAQRLKVVAKALCDNAYVSSEVSIDEEYLYEALCETAFTISMEDVVALGISFQIIQVEFDENGHFKATELDEVNY